MSEEPGSFVVRAISKHVYDSRMRVEEFAKCVVRYSQLFDLSGELFYLFLEVVVWREAFGSVVLARLA